MGYFYSEQKESVETQKAQTLLEIKQLLKNDFITDQVVDLKPSLQTRDELEWGSTKFLLLNHLS